MKKNILKILCSAIILSSTLKLSLTNHYLLKFAYAEIPASQPGASNTIDNENKELDENTGLKIDSIEKFKYAKSLKVKNLEGGYRLIEIGKEKLLVIPEGKEKPENLKDGVESVKLPIRRVLPISTADLGYLCAIGSVEDIVAVTREEKDIGLTEIKKAMGEGKIEFVGVNKALDYEKIAGLKLDFVYNVATGISYYGKITAKLDELGIPKISLSLYKESDPRARIEWVKFIGIMHGKEKEAAEWFNKEVAKIDEIEKKNLEKPAGKKIIGFRLSPKGVTVKVDQDYSVKMMELAGGINPLKETVKGENGTKLISFEEFYVMAQDADILIHENMGPIFDTYDKMLEIAPVLADLKAFKNKNVWTTSKDYWMHSHKLSDMIVELNYIMTEENKSDLEFYKKVK